MNQPQFLAHMSLESAAGATLSDTRIRLLEEIERHGSINRAAAAVPLSYKAAWEAIDTMNNLSPEPLVLRVSSGRQGGGTQLTAYGKRLIAMYRALQTEYQQMLDKVSARLGEAGEADDVHAIRQLMRRIRMQCSARNQFHGRLFALREGGAVDFEVGVRLDDGSEIISVITRTSAENLNLRPGLEVLAMVKASSVMLEVDGNATLAARNQLWGEVIRLHESPRNHEVTLSLPGGRTVTAVQPKDRCETLGIQAGMRACAFFDASSVLLATFD